MLLHFKITPKGKEEEWPGFDHMSYEGEDIQVTFDGISGVSVTMSENLTLGQHRKTLEHLLPGYTVELSEQAQKAPPQLQELNLDSIDLVNFKSTGVPVWDNIFRKPPPVFDRGNWGASDASDDYIYIPNCTKYGGEATEDFNSNAMYTQVMLTAYKQMCAAKGIDPVVRLRCGNHFPVSTLHTRHGVHNSEPGERAAGLANSSLVDFDDSPYGKAFLDAVVAIPAAMISREPARRTVLSKCEYILAGKASHTYNQRFVKNFLELLSVKYFLEFRGLFKDKTEEAQANIVGIFRAMVMDGFVLDSGETMFEERLWAASLGEYSEFFLRVYHEAS